MSLEVIKSVFENLNNGFDWSLQLLNIKTSKKMGIGYSCRQIELSPNERLNVLLNDISQIYIGSGKKSIDQYREVREYDGTTDAFVIYKLPIHSELISEEYERFTEAIADPDIENDPFAYTSAYLIKGKISINNTDIPVKLVSMQNPTTTLKHKFFHNNGVFRELSSKVLSLRPTMDILIINDNIYFLTLAGENLFNMARAYKNVCHKKIEMIKQFDIVDNFDDFKAVAESGHNPRKFISFDEDKLNALKKKKVMIKMSNRFNIPMNQSGDKFDVSIDGAAEKIIKLLCKKGMIDPFDDIPVEVDGARKWQ